jgi:hypothetical protein
MDSDHRLQVHSSASMELLELTNMEEAAKTIHQAALAVETYVCVLNYSVVDSLSQETTCSRASCRGQNSRIRLQELHHSQGKGVHQVSLVLMLLGRTKNSACCRSVSLRQL